MTFSVDKLKANIGGGNGLALANQWSIVLPRIAGTVADGRELNLLCKSAIYPGRQMIEQQRVIGVKPTPVASSFTEEPVILQFWCLNSWGVKNYFEAWQNQVIDQNTYRVGYLNEYSGRVAIHHLKKGMSYDLDLKTNNISKISELLGKLFNRFLPNVNLDLDVNFGANTNYSIVLEDAYPSQIAAMNLTNDLDGLLEVVVTLSYRTWRRV